MTVDLWMLIASTMLFFVMYAMFQGFALIQHIGLAGAAGNRDQVPAASGWKGRVNRTVKNHSDNLIVFAILVVVAHISGNANDMTATGAVVFFAARLVHAACYITGVSWIRTLAWVTCVVGMAIIFSQLF
ncbi:MAG: MAPEG family protein [Proteobacteria bacterium]|nr:MAPEG family protein [Pseudomonadota bacterium]